MPMRKKVMYILSQIGDSKEFTLLADHWDRGRHDLWLVLLHADPDSPLQRHTRARGHTCTTIPYTGWSSALPCAWRLYRLMRRARPDVVNANLLVASLLGLFAARLAGVRMAIYTRHHTTHNHKYHPVRGVLYDRICNALAHRIIAISEVTRDVLIAREGVRPEKIVLVHHGFDLSHPPRPDEAKGRALREKYGLDRSGRSPILGVIARPYEWKGLDHIIAAFARFVQERPQAHLLLFNWSRTDQVERYERLLHQLPPGTWQTIAFEKDVHELYPVFDTFVHVPEDAWAEAFGFVYIEASVSGTPSIFTASGIMRELENDGLEGIRIVPFKDDGAILEALRTCPTDTDAERAERARRNTAVLQPKLGIERKLNALYELYAAA